MGVNAIGSAPECECCVKTSLGGTMIVRPAGGPRRRTPPAAAVAFDALGLCASEI